jgi:hypothetical protein
VFQIMKNKGLIDRHVSKTLNPEKKSDFHEATCLIIHPIHGCICSVNILVFILICILTLCRFPRSVNHML